MQVQSNPSLSNSQISTLIDLRSDTVTRPTEAMRQVMAQAVVGDDVIDVDPTTAELEHTVAELLGKEAAIFMPSGTMTNQVGIRLHCSPGDEFLCEYECHIYTYEQGAFAQLSQLVAHTVQGEFGLLTLDHLRDRIRPENDHMVRTRLVCLENTHNRGGGRIYPIETIDEICEWAHSMGLKTHLDGARLFNAAVATGIPEKRWAERFDSVSVCMSKGLGAPIGSCLAGSKEYIKRARRVRKLFGGGMRQTGIISSAALYALRNHRQRLVEDHANAQLLGNAIATSNHLKLAPPVIDTNIVIFRVDPIWGTAPEFVSALLKQGVQCSAFGPYSIRMVTHLDVSTAQIEQACQAIQLCDKQNPR